MPIPKEVVDDATIVEAGSGGVPWVDTKNYWDGREDPRDGVAETYWTDDAWDYPEANVEEESSWHPPAFMK